MAVGFGEDKGLGHFISSGEQGRQCVAKGADDVADLAWIDDVTVELGGCIGDIFVKLLPPFAP